jgi:hypothetical protein
VRRRNRAALSGPAAELAAAAAECEAAAGLGDVQAAERLRAVRSWMDMLRLSGDDPDVGELFVAFARDDWVLSRLRRGAA